MTLLNLGTTEWTGSDASESVGVYSNNGPVTLHGMGGDDTLQGARGTDVLNGGAGDDFLVGGGGAWDILRGGDGADTLRGGTGSDYMKGGAGADVFQFKAPDITPGAVDSIIDFESGVDVLEFEFGSPTITGAEVFEINPYVTAYSLEWTVTDGGGNGQTGNIWVQGVTGFDPADVTGAAYDPAAWDALFG